jgi:hypothetical protein
VQQCARALQTLDECVADIDCPIADGKHLARILYFGRHTQAMKLGDYSLGRQFVQ